MPDRSKEAAAQLLAAIPGVGVYEWRVAEDRLVWSPELMRIYGLAEAPEGERGFTERVHPDDRTRVEAETASFMGAGAAYAHEFRIIRPDGEIRLIHDRGVIERADNGEIVSVRGINIDRTGQGLAQVDGHDADEAAQALRASEERLRLASEAAGFGVYDFDVAQRRSFWSPELLRITGRADQYGFGSMEEALSDVHPDDRARVSQEMEAATRRVGRYKLEYRIRRPDGSVRWVADRGQSFGPLDAATGRARRGAGTLVDITERKRAEEALRASEERFRGLFERAGTGIAIADLGGRFKSCNPAFQALLGCSATDLRTRGFADLVHPDHRDPNAAGLQRLVADELPSFEAVTRYIRNDRKALWVHQHVSLLRDAGGHPSHMVALVTDMTKQRRAEEHLGQVMREVSHRSRNILALVLAIARQSVGSDPEAFLDRFGQRIQALAASQDLLVRTDGRGVALQDLIRSQLGHFSDTPDGRILISGPELVVTAAAAQIIGMAMHELATNAGKYGALSNLQGRVEISWRTGSPEPGKRRLTISWIERGGPVVTAPSQRGFGSTVIDAMVAHSLGATVAIDFAAEGLTWRMECSDECLLD